MDEPLPPLVHLGRFAAPLAARVTQVLAHRHIDHATVAVEDPDELTVTVDAAWRDDVAAELFTNWPELVAGLDPDDRARLTAGAGSHPGWLDAPADAWIDDLGRLRVDEADGDADDARAVGPALIVGGLALALLGMVADTVPTGFGVTFGVIAIVFGLLLPR